MTLDEFHSPPRADSTPCSFSSRAMWTSAFPTSPIPLRDRRSSFQTIRTPTTPAVAAVIAASNPLRLTFL